MPSAQNRTAKGSILKEDEILCPSWLSNISMGRIIKITHINALTVQVLFKSGSPIPVLYIQTLKLKSKLIIMKLSENGNFNYS